MRHPWRNGGSSHPYAELERCPRMDKCPCSQDSNRTFEIRAPPWMARCRDGEKGPEIKHRLSRVWRATPSEGFAFVSAKFWARNVEDEGRFVQERTVPAPPVLCCPSLVHLLARGSAITRSDAFAVVVTKLGFNSTFIGRAGNRTFPAGIEARMPRLPGILPSCKKD